MVRIAVVRIAVVRIAVVRIAVCGPGSHVRIVTPQASMLRGQIVHLQEEPDRYDPPDAPWWTREEFAAVAARMAKETGIPAIRARANMEHLQRLGLAPSSGAGIPITASWCAWTCAPFSGVRSAVSGARTCADAVAHPERTLPPLYARGAGA